jgi:hypothetical protein
MVTKAQFSACLYTASRTIMCLLPKIDVFKRRHVK